MNEHRLLPVSQALAFADLTESKKPFVRSLLDHCHLDAGVIQVSGGYLSPERESRVGLANICLVESNAPQVRKQSKNSTCSSLDRRSLHTLVVASMADLRARSRPS